MRSPEDIIDNWSKIPLETENWKGLNFVQLITDSFALPEDDGYVYVAEQYSMDLKEVQTTLSSAIWRYQYSFGHGAIPVR